MKGRAYPYQKEVEKLEFWFFDGPIWRCIVTIFPAVKRLLWIHNDVRNSRWLSAVRDSASQFVWHRVCQWKHLILKCSNRKITKNWCDSALSQWVSVPDSAQLWHKDVPDSTQLWHKDVPDSAQLWHKDVPDSAQLWHKDFPDSAQLWHIWTATYASLTSLKGYFLNNQFVQWSVQVLEGCVTRFFSIFLFHESKLTNPSGL